MLSTINAAANNAKNVSNRTEEHEAEEREASLDEARQGRNADIKADEETDDENDSLNENSATKVLDNSEKMTADDTDMSFAEKDETTQNGKDNRNATSNATYDDIDTTQYTADTPNTTDVKINAIDGGNETTRDAADNSNTTDANVNTAHADYDNIQHVADNPNNTDADVNVHEDDAAANTGEPEHNKQKKETKHPNISVAQQLHISVNQTQTGTHEDLVTVEPVSKEVSDEENEDVPTDDSVKIPEKAERVDTDVDKGVDESKGTSDENTNADKYDTEV